MQAVVGHCKLDWHEALYRKAQYSFHFAFAAGERSDGIVVVVLSQLASTSRAPTPKMSRVIPFISSSLQGRDSVRDMRNTRLIVALTLFTACASCGTETD